MRNSFCGFGLLIALCVHATSLQAQQHTGPASSKHSLWKIQGQQNSVYLLGSIHVLRKEDYPLPQ